VSIQPYRQRLADWHFLLGLVISDPGHVLDDPAEREAFVALLGRLRDLIGRLLDEQ